MEGRFWDTLAVICWKQSMRRFGFAQNVYLLIINNPFFICFFNLHSQWLG